MKENYDIAVFSRKTFCEVLAALKEFYGDEHTHIVQIEILEVERLVGSYYKVTVWYEDVE